MTAGSHVIAANGGSDNTPNKFVIEFNSSFTSVVSRFEQQFPNAKKVGYCEKVGECGKSRRVYATFNIEKPVHLNILPKGCLAGVAQNLASGSLVDFNFDEKNPGLSSITVRPSLYMSDRAIKQYRDQVLRDYRRQFRHPIWQKTSEPPNDEGWSATWRIDQRLVATLSWNRFEIAAIQCYEEPLPKLPIRSTQSKELGAN